MRPSVQRALISSLGLLALAACSPKPAAQQPAEAPKAAAPAPNASKSTAPAGAYDLDPAHTNVSFHVDHLGFSHYTADFDTVNGKLAFDPANPTAMTVEATIDVKSLDLNTPPKGFRDEILGPMFFEAAKFPTITFKSTKVETTGPYSAKVTGDFTLHGVTKPVTLDVTFNGGWKANPYDGDRIGFSAHTTIKRSEFGMGNGVPPPGTTMGVSDEVQIAIETEAHAGKPVGDQPAS